MFLFKLILLGIFFYILFIFLKYFLNFLLNNSLSKKCSVVRGKQPFHFNSISFNSPDLKFSVTNIKLDINLLGILLSQTKFLVFQLGDISVEIINIPNKAKTKKSEENKQKQITPFTVVLHAFYYFQVCLLSLLFRSALFEFKSLNIKFRIFNYLLKGFRFSYQRIGKQFKIDINIGKTTINIAKEQFTIEPIKNSSSYDLAPIMTLYNYESILIPIDISFPAFEFSCNKDKITIHSIIVSVLLPRGSVPLSFKNINITSSVSVPPLLLKIKEFSFFKSVSLVDVKRLNLDVLFLEVKRITLYNEERQVIDIKKLKLDTKYKKLDVSCKSINVNYNTLTGLSILSCAAPYIYHRHRDPSTTPPMKIAFPDINVNVSSLILTLKFSDLAILKGDFGKVKMKDRAFQIPNVAVFLNQMKTITIKPLRIDDAKNQLHFVAGKIHLHDRKQFYIYDFLRDLVKSWRAIAPYVLDKFLEKESIPFPIYVEADSLKAKFDDYPVNIHLSRAVRVMPKHIINDAVRRKIFTEKTNSLNLPPESIADGEMALSKLTFDEYRKEIEKTKLHKFQFYVDIKKPKFLLDCVGFINKVQKMGEWDPTTKEFYPDMVWEFLIGGQSEIKADELKAYFYDIEEPLIHIKHGHLHGPVVFAEGKNQQQSPTHMTVDGQDVIAIKNASDFKLYTNMKIEIDNFQAIYGTSYRKIYHTINDIIRTLIPYFPDPSARPEWWDILRFQLRGRFAIKVKHAIIKVSAVRDYTDTHDYTGVHFHNLAMKWKEGKLNAGAHMFRAVRVGEGKQSGITLMEFPHFDVKAKYIWSNKSGINPRLHFIMPDVSTFNDPENCDSFADYRATGLKVNLKINFTMSHNIIPHFTFDCAHFKWLFGSMLMFLKDNIINFQISQKYYLPHKKKNKIVNINQLHIEGNIDISCNFMYFQIFDHFPISNTKIKGSSVDMKINELAMKFKVKYHRSKFTDVKYDGYIGEIEFCATDLYQYCSVDKPRTNSFFTIKPIQMVSDENKNKMIIKEIQINIDQIILGYLFEFVGTAKAITEALNGTNVMKIPKEAPKIQDSYQNTIARFTNVIDQSQISSIKFNFTSVETELNVVIDFSKNLASILTEEKTGCIAYRLNIDHLSVYSNSKSPKVDTNHPLLTVNKITIFMTKSLSYFNSESAELAISAVDFTSLHLVFQECFSAKRNMSLDQVDQKSNVLFAIYISIPKVVGELLDSNNTAICRGELIDTTLKYLQNDNMSRSITLIIDGMDVKDLVPGFIYPQVIKRWTEKDNPNTKQPHIMVQLVSLPGVAGCMLYSHIELNMSPTIAKYEKAFFNLFIDFFNQDLPKMARQSVAYLNQKKNKIEIPFVTYPAENFPTVEESLTDIVKQNKSSEYNLMKNPQNTSVFVRYFRLNPFLVNISYKNPDNKLIQLINDFNGQCTEILYHDFNGSMAQFIQKLKKEISHILLPQLMKHIVGIKERDATNKQDVGEWLNTEDGKMSKNDKRKEMLFGHKNLKNEKK